MFNITAKYVLRSVIIINLLLCLHLLARAAENSDLVAASAWIDREIHDKNGQPIGEIDDLVIKRSGKIKKVTIDVGGFLVWLLGGSSPLSATPPKINKVIPFIGIPCRRATREWLNSWAIMERKKPTAPISPIIQ